MGLDSVELVLEVEETFGFSIPDRDVERLDTVGKLYDYILMHRFESRQDGCLTSVAFYKLRRALMSVLGMARGNVRLSLELAALIPTRRRQRWSDLQAAMGLRLPPLMRPTWVTAVAMAVGGALAVAPPVLLAARVRNPAPLYLWPITLFAVGYALYQATKPLAVAFSREFATVGGLTNAILRRNYGVLSDECQRANAAEIWDTLRSLIAEQLGVRLDDVTMEANFVKDLGVG